MADYLATLMVGGSSAPCVETVDLGTLKTLNVLSFPGRFLVSVAATAALNRLFLTDGQNDVVVVADGLSGAVVTTIPILAPMGCMLSADEQTLFVMGGTLGVSSVVVHAIDTTTFAVTSSAVLPLDEYVCQRGALSPDGRLLATASATPAPALEVLITGSLNTARHVAFPAGSAPQHAMFAAPDRVLVWDSVHDRLYQVDVPSGAVLAAATIQLPADVSWHNGQCTAFSRSTGRACIVKSQPVLPVSWALATVDPVTTAVDTYGGFTGQPGPLCLSRDERVAYVGIYHHDQPVPGSPTLTTLDIAGKVISHDVFTFSVPSTMFPAWMAVVPGPRDVLDRIRGTALLTQILAGVIDDSPGVVIPPGGGPTPVGPWVGRWRDLSPATRDVLLGLALHELAALSTRSGEQTEIQRAALALAANGLARLGKE